jgi:outer membrane protein assembly factor BamB
MQSCRSLLPVVLCALTSTGLAADWPQFHGLHRDNCCPEKGLLDKWPEAGPRLLWKMTGLGKGYSSVSIVGGKLYTMGDRESEGENRQMVMAIDMESRQPVWHTAIGAPHKDGPRCTPTVDGELLYVVGTDGDVVCLETSTGKIRWQKNFGRDFGGRMMSIWKYSESPLVDGDRVVCTPGGAEATIVALDKRTGATVWKCAVPDLGDRGKDGAAYSSIVSATLAGVPQYVQMLGRGVVGVEAQTGRFLWGYNRVANKVANITAPVVFQDYVFATSAYKTGSVLLKITRNGAEMKADEVYWLDSTTFVNHHGGVVLVGDHIYGADGQNGGVPACVEFLTGKVAWKGKSQGAGSAAVLYADGHLYFRYQNGMMALVESTPQECRVTGTFSVGKPSGPAWSHPVIVDKKLYLRDNDTLSCYDVGK